MLQRAAIIARIVVLVAFIMAPLLALLIHGPVAEYGFEFNRFPAPKAVFAHARAARNNLGEAILDRSLLKREAISLRNSLTYALFGYLDTNDVVSGLDGWLFYKKQFSNDGCLDPASAAPAFTHVAAMIDMAAAANIRLILAVAPDKSIVYPEKLHPHARAYWTCKAESGAVWRRLATAEAPSIIDLSHGLLAGKEANPGAKLYFATDTHWTRLGAAIARRQLFAALSGRDTVLPPPRVLDEPLSQATDLNRILLLRASAESAPDLDLSDEAKVDAEAALDLGRTAFVHDSFVNAWLDDFKAAFPAEFFYTNQPAAGYEAATMAAVDAIIVLTVERHLLSYLQRSILTWQAPVGAGILMKSARAAASCAIGSMPEGPAGQDPERISGEAKTLTVGIPSTPGRSPCIVIGVTSRKPVVVELALPAKRDAQPDDSFPPGGSIEIAVPAGTQEIRLALPPYVMGGKIRLGLAGGIPLKRVRSVAVGTIPDRGGEAAP